MRENGAFRIVRTLQTPKYLQKRHDLLMIYENDETLPQRGKWNDFRIVVYLHH